MLHQPILPRSDRWCILRTAPPRTLALAASLKAAGFEVWTPTAVKRAKLLIKRDSSAPAKPPREYSVPILATFVFARPADVPTLLAIAADPLSQYPRFSIYQIAGRIPVVSDRELVGLHDAEDDAAAAIAAIREGENREHRRQERAMAMRTERARRKALRATGVAVARDTEVTIHNHPAFAGMTAVVVSSTDREAEVSFGNGFRWKVETWLLRTDRVQAAPQALTGAAQAA